MVIKAFHFSIAVVTLVILSLTGVSCSRKTEPAVKYHYTVVKNKYMCSADDIKNNSFDIKSFRKGYEQVRTAAVDVLSQRGAVLDIEQDDNHTIIISGYGQLGTFYNALIAVSMIRYRKRLTEVSVSWINPQNSQCERIMIDTSDLKEIPLESLPPLKQRQAIAYMVGTEFLIQLSTQIHGPLKWHRKFW
jgi:hypothetical protein